MVKKIKVTLPNKGASAIFDLVEDLAPRTCRAIWDSLPHEGTATHCKTLGSTVWTSLRPGKQLKEVPRENFTIYPIPGDLLYSYFPPAWEGGRRGSTEGICDLIVCYGRESPLLGTEGPILFNHFGTISDNLDAFAKAANRILHEGADKIVIEKAE